MKICPPRIGMADGFVLKASKTKILIASRSANLSTVVRLDHDT